MVAEFSSAVEAVRCAINIQQEIERSNAGIPPDRQMRFRIGINLGGVIVEDDNLLGDGVNVAARIEALATEGGLCVSQSIYEQVRDFECPIFLAQAYHALGLSDKSEAAGRLGFERIEAELQLRPENVRAIYLGASFLATTGQGNRALDWIGRALLMEPDDVRTQYNAACVYAKLGELDLAIDLLGKAPPIAHSEIRAWVQHDTDLDSLRLHPRFIALLESTAG